MKKKLKIFYFILFLSLVFLLVFGFKGEDPEYIYFKMGSYYMLKIQELPQYKKAKTKGEAINMAWELYQKDKKKK